MTRVEVSELKAQVDLAELIAMELGTAQKQSGRWFWWPCPFHDDRDPSFGVTPDNGQWKCFGCGLSGDHIDWLERYRGLSTGEAINELTQLAGLPHMRISQTANIPQTSSARGAPPSLWQESGRAFATWAQEQLWSNSGVAGLEYLRGGGLTDRTIKTAGLGWNPTDLWRKPERWGLEAWTNKRGRPGRLWLPRGVVYPCEVSHELWYLKVRRFNENGEPEEGGHKYVQIKGSASALFGADRLLSDGRPMLLTEGERDYWLAWQELAHLVDVATLGGAGKRDLDRGHPWLLPYKHIFGAYDADDSGRSGIRELAVLNSRILPIEVPHGRDLADFHTAGGDLSVWLQMHLARLRAPVSSHARPASDSETQLAADLEARAAEILRENPTEREAQLDQCRRYAAVVTELGITCTKCASWADWVADVESDLVVTGDRTASTAAQ